MTNTRVCVGAIAGAFGVRGEVRLKSFCAEPEAIGTYSPLWTENGARSFDVTLTGTIKNGLSARLSGIKNKEAADQLKGIRLYVDREKLPAPDEDEFYHADLIGLDVVDTGGTPLGRVKAVLNHGAGDILEVQPPSGPTLLLPFTKETVPTVDLSAQRLVADLPEDAD
ncbi:MAG: ribosome maturation factor RimM [Pseudomonadota bacterium]